jgi:hypothetical protein
MRDDVYLEPYASVGRGLLLKYWVNIDKPTKCYLHTDSCNKVLREATPLKGIDEEKADGGWFSFNSRQEAEDYFKKRFPDKDLFAHYCIEEHI